MLFYVNIRLWILLISHGGGPNAQNNASQNWARKLRPVPKNRYKLLEEQNLRYALLCIHTLVDLAKVDKTPLKMHRKCLKTFKPDQFFARNRSRLVSTLCSYAMLRYASGYNQKSSSLVNSHIPYHLETVVLQLFFCRDSRILQQELRWVQMKWTQRWFGLFGDYLWFITKPKHIRIWPSHHCLVV